MFVNERREQITELLSRRPSVTVAELTGLFQVSQETIRKDLEYLERQGVLRRVHGGALSVKKMQTYASLPERLELQREQNGDFPGGHEVCEGRRKHCAGHRVDGM